MNYIAPPISYAKINPLGQLIIGLENGTILTAGNVIGPQGRNGPLGHTGPTGPVGPMGFGVSNLSINSQGELLYSLSNHPHKFFNAGLLPVITGPQGPVGDRGASISNGILQNDNLVFVTEKGEYINVGKVYGATGPQGIAGPTGPPGPPFRISRIFSMNNNLLIVDENNVAYNCGYMGITGPTGPSQFIQDITLEEQGLLKIKTPTQDFSVGPVLGAQGPIGPTGPRGRPGPMLKLQNIHFNDSRELIFQDTFGTEYNAGKLTILEDLIDEVQKLKDKLERL